MREKNLENMMLEVLIGFDRWEDFVGCLMCWCVGVS